MLVYPRVCGVTVRLYPALKETFNLTMLKVKVKFGIKERRRYREEGRLNPREDMIRVPL
jgi:hypothetical protein